MKSLTDYLFDRKNKQIIIDGINYMLPTIPKHLEAFKSHKGVTRRMINMLDMKHILCNCCGRVHQRNTQTTGIWTVCTLYGAIYVDGISQKEAVSIAKCYNHLHGVWNETIAVINPKLQKINNKIKKIQLKQSKRRSDKIVSPNGEIIST